MEKYHRIWKWNLLNQIKMEEKKFCNKCVSVGCTCTRRVNAANESLGGGWGRGTAERRPHRHTHQERKHIRLTILARFFYISVRSTIWNIGLGTEHKGYYSQSLSGPTWKVKLVCTKARTDTQYDTADEKRTPNSNGVHRSLSVYEPLCRLSRSGITTPPLTGYMTVSPDWSTV